MKLLVFGLGYTARSFVDRTGDRFDAIVATRREPPPPPFGRGLDTTAAASSPLPPGEGDRPKGGGEGTPRTGVNPVAASGPTLRAFPGDEAVLAADIAEADAILVSIPPDPAMPGPHDPVLAAFAETLRQAARLRWLGYLSTVGVYGDHAGAWIDETTVLAPNSRRTRARVVAEEAWLTLAAEHGLPVHVFRIAGIYGPGRSAFDKLADGTARRIVKPGQVFNRIHVDDIARVLEASLDRPRPGAIYNVADDEPAPPQDVIAEAARLAGVPPPPEIAFAEAELSPMAASFWGETKRVSNARLREELGVELAYPTYREGLRAIGRARLTRPSGSPRA